MYRNRCCYPTTLLEEGAQSCLRCEKPEHWGNRFDLLLVRIQACCPNVQVFHKTDDIELLFTIECHLNRVDVVLKTEITPCLKQIHFHKILQKIFFVFLA